MNAKTEFDGEQFPDAYPDGIENHYWNSARQSLIGRRVLRMPRQSGDLVIDIGCGRGHTVADLLRQGVDAIGVDLGEPIPAFPSVAAHLYLGQDVFALPDSLRRRCRSILLLDVLEHLPEPDIFVRRLAEMFPRCDRILMTFPARQELWSNYDEHYGHYQRYDMAAARSLMARTPFQLQECEYFFHALYVPARLLGMLKKPRSVRIAAPTSSNRWMHRLIRTYFLAEQRLLPRRWPGTSIMAIGERDVASLARAA
jgi:SAM-dependent methyltransferase